VSKILLVTGGYGFIGSHFIIHALKAGYKVVNLDKVTYAASEYVIRSFKNLPGLTNIVGNINDEDLCRSIFKKFSPSGLINFAAETHVDNSIKSAASFIDTNISGSHNLLKVSEEHYREKNEKFRFLQVSTDEVFGSLGKNGTFDERSKIAPRNPYSATKAAADHLVYSWYNTYDLPIIITNASNNFGAHQNIEKLIPKTIYSIINNDTISVYGDGANVRDWLYVEDHVKSLLLIYERGRIGDRYCVGGGKELSNIRLIEMLCQIVDKKIGKSPSSLSLIKFVPDRLGHDFRYAIDDKKFVQEFGKVSNISFEEKIADTVIWYVNHFSESL
tara:strand:+ start:1463 stop:2455 length:993 start_codon:yes stop_codon:yes gene_type:complete